MPLCTLERWRSRRHAWPKLWKHHAAQPVADRLNEVALERGEAFLERYGGRISSEWYFPKLIEVWLEDREIYDECRRLHRGDRLDRLVADRGRVPSDRDRRVQGDVVTGATACHRPSTSRPPIPASTTPARSSATRSSRSGRKAGTLRPEVAKKVGLSESVAVAVGNVDAWVSVPGVGVDGAGDVRGRDRDLDLRHDRPPRGDAAARASPAWSRTGSSRACTATRPDRRRSATCSPGSSSDIVMDPGSYGAARGSRGARLSPARPDWSRSTGGTATARSWPTPISPARSSASDCTPRASRSTARCSSRSRSGAAGSWTTSRSTGSCSSQIVACGGIAERSPLMMQLLADTSGREVHVPEVAEIPARGAALFGGGGGRRVRRTSAAPIEATRPKTVRTYKPDLEAKKTYDRVYEIYRTLYDMLGRSEVRLLHELKRIRTERREA